MKLNRNIKIGDTGEDVNYLQSKLVEYGIYNYYMSEVFDEQTLKCFNLFQEKMNLPITDYVNIKSWNHLEKYYEIIEQQELKENQAIVITSNNFIIYEIPFESKNLITENKKNIVINIVGNINTTAEMVAYNYNKINTHYIIDSEKVYRNFNCSYGLNGHNDTIYVSIVNSGELMVGYDKKLYDRESNFVDKNDSIEINDLIYHKLKNELIFNLGEVLKTIKNIHGNDLICHINLHEQEDLISIINQIFPPVIKEETDDVIDEKPTVKKKRITKKVVKSFDESEK